MMHRRLCFVTHLLGAVALVGFLSLDASAGHAPKKLTKYEADPAAPTVGLFEGIDAGQFDVTVVPHDSKGGVVLIENKADAPLNVELPEAFAGKHVLKQFGGGLGGQQGGLGAGGLGGQGGGLGGQGGGQGIGGGLGGQGGGGFGGQGGGGFGGQGGGGGGLFSIPPETVARVPYHSVCLEYGKPEPMPRMTYQLMPVEQYTQDPVLQELVGLIARNEIDEDIAQAAAWHLSDHMSWQKLASLSNARLGGLPPEPVFSRNQLGAAQSLVARATEVAREKAKERPESDSSSASDPTPIR